MGGISDANVEWAVVNRLKMMLEEPPETKFNVTQAFALFSTVLLWTKNRIWVAGNAYESSALIDEADRAAHDVRQRLRDARICDEPWFLSRAPPQTVLLDAAGKFKSGDAPTNADFADMTAEAFFKWLRDALAHGDGRNIKPIHKRSLQGGRTFLAGFQVKGRNAAGPVLSLYNVDMRRMGSKLADLFCATLSATDRYHDWDEATVGVNEAA